MAAAPQPPQSHQALYRAVMKEAAAQGRALMQRTVRRAALDMPALAARNSDVVERNLLAEAAKVLMKHEAHLVDSFPQALLSEFARAIAGDARKGAVSFDSLELMGEEQVQESVEVVRTQQSVLMAAEAALAELNALMSAVQDLKTVQPERNPLRSDVYVRALRDVIHASPVSPAVRRRWMIHLGSAMGPELALTYQELSMMLRSQGVSEAGYNVVHTAPPPGPAPAQDKRLNVHELKRLLAGEFDTTSPPAEEAPPADFSMTVPAAFEALQEMRQLEQVKERMRNRQGRTDALAPGQQLSLEVVQLMVDNIAGDARLLPPVQQAVRDLAPALMRLALGDPRFFSDKRHPARQLLEEVTQRSLAWASADAPGFTAFMEPLRQAVDALVDTQVGGAETFDFALKSLHDAWGDAQQRDRRYREKAVRALLQAEQRNLLADKIAREVRARHDLQAAPREIAQFVLGPWSQVLAQARLNDAAGAADPDGYAGIIPELLWSAQPQLAAGNPARLTRLVPQLVDKLKRGLASINYPAAQAQRFLQHLAQLHEQALKPAAPAQAPLTRAELEAQFGGDAEAGSWLAPLEAQESGFLPTHQSVHAQPPLYQATQPAAFGETQREAEEAPLAPQLPDVGLAPGAWVEMFEGQWTRWQLTWASPHGTLYLFTHVSGRTQSMTRRLLEKMLAGGALRLVSGQAVVDGALDAVAQAALKNSV